jgi:hypothetical protein
MLRHYKAICGKDLDLDPSKKALANKKKPETYAKLVI